jgi:hypothetical protein
MSENKPHPKASRQSRRKAALEPLGWEEIISQPGMGGYLSFLNGPVPLPHLQPTAPEAASDPGVASTPAPDINTAPEAEIAPEVISPTEPLVSRDPTSGPGVVLSPVPEDVFPGLRQGPVINLIPVVVSTPPKRHKIRKCVAAQDGHSLGEEILYQALWKMAVPESARSRTIVIGWRGMSQICRMTPKNCKINAQRLIRKLALEILSPYNTPESIGTTYRIYTEEAILERRRAAGLEWVVRSRGVEFVDPATKSILPMCADT